jgi:hypothetical protein
MANSPPSFQSTAHPVIWVVSITDLGRVLGIRHILQKPLGRSCQLLCSRPQRCFLKVPACRQTAVGLPRQWDANHLSEP